MSFDIKKYWHPMGTHKEWKDVCDKWDIPKSKPEKHVSSLKEADLYNKRIVVFPQDKDLFRRDCGLVAPDPYSTPERDNHFWVSGISSVKIKED